MLEEVEKLRKEIDEVDEEIVQLIHRRLEIAKKIGLAKRKIGAPIRDLAREIEVEDRWIKLSREKNIPEDLAREVARLLIRYSLAVQGTLITRSRRIALIGYGAMAKILGEIMKLAGHHVMIGGRDSIKARNLAEIIGCSYGEPKDIISEGDYVVLALSREAFSSGYVDDLAIHMRYKIVMDILSAKTEIYEKMVLSSKKHRFSYISTHPLFGPTSFPYGETIVLIPGNSAGEVLEEVVVFWSSIGLVPIVAGYDEHERAMAVVQVIPHLYMLALSEAIDMLSKRYGIEYRMFMTHNMKKIDEIIERIRHNIEVVREIQVHNKYASEAREAGVQKLVEIAGMFGGVHK